MHELRRGEMAACRRGAAHAVLRQRGRHAALRLAPRRNRALDRRPGPRPASCSPPPSGRSQWIDQYGDLDGDGFVEYRGARRAGSTTRAGRTRTTACRSRDGRLPEPPIALVEVQGYVVAAKQGMAGLFETLGEPDRAVTLRAEADDLAARIREAYWIEDLGFFALALDGEKRQVPTITSNPGHLLLARRRRPRSRPARMANILLGDGDVLRLGHPDRGAEPAGLQPVVVPQRDGLAARQRAHRAGARALRAAARGRDRAGRAVRHIAPLPLHRLPELFCGIWRGETDAPVAYPVSCSPQAWAAGSLFPIIQGILGIEPEATRQELRLVRPHLPPRLRYLDVLRLAVGKSRVSLQFNRVGDRTMANVLEVEGEPLNVRIGCRVNHTRFDRAGPRSSRCGRPDGDAPGRDAAGGATAGVRRCRS